MKRIGFLFLLLLVCLFYQCPFRLIFHINCPGCGMTRAIFAAIRLDFKAAFQYHPLFPLVLLGGAYYVFREKIQKILKIENKQENWILAAVGVIFLIRWIFCVLLQL